MADGKAAVGCWVTIRDDQVDETWRIVPSREANVIEGWMSEDSPLARALLGHAPGDVVQVRCPAGRRPVTLLAVDRV